jgi:hypothetical protein
MKHLTRLLLVVLIGLITSVSFTLALTCDELRAEIARLQQTLANETRDLANCNNHPGTCTPGQKTGIEQAKQIAQQEIDADQAQLITACAPPPLPNVDHVTLQGIEVVQAIQDIANSVKLIAGKTTWVRVYLGKNSGTRTVTATMQAKRDTTTVTLNPAASITVNATETLTMRRQNWNKSLNFAVPAALMSSGTTVFTVDTPTDTSPTPKSIICDDCGAPTQVSFFNMPPLISRAIGLTYQFQPTAGAPQQTATPRAIDYTLLQSWLTRAYPVAEVAVSQTTTAVNFALVFDSTTKDCTQADAQLLAIRTFDVDEGGTDERTHYMGLVSNQGNFMRGCAGLPLGTPIASGPSGAPAGPNIPSNASGDSDASFADWYGGHELAHTFGRKHPGFCFTNSKDDASFPYPNGQISDATERSFAGLDVGDTPNGVGLAVLWGSTTFDIMTYCTQPDWPSAYTYEALRHQLLIENPGFKLQRLIPAPLTGTVLVGPLVHVVATMNLTKGTGSINYVSPVTRALPSFAPNGRAELVVHDPDGKELFRQAVAIQELSDIQAGEDRMALIDATMPFREDMAQIQLELDGAILARYTNVQTTPPPVSGVKIAQQLGAPGPTITWNAPPASAGTVTFTVLAQDKSNQWRTIAVGLTVPKLTLSTDQASTSTLRVTGNNGFRSSLPVVVALCPELMVRVAKAQIDFKNFQEAINNGEIPPPPKTPQRIAKVVARLHKLRHDLSVAEAQLSQCQARNP